MTSVGIQEIAALEQDTYWRERAVIGGVDQCWPWIGSRNAKGYGIARRTSSNRYTYQLIHGMIPPGMVVMHSCDNPPCVNPRHLSLGSHLDNLRDAQAKGRRPVAGKSSQCRSGHRMTAENTYEYNGKFYCRACRASYQRGLRMRRRAGA